ncbi:MAG TPA: DNA gyrase subunit A, partial [Oligoflexia bacterium]|nr:DNA gyrase subunit A [Oligoflexia bacterium]
MENTNLIPVTIEDEMRGSYLDYAMSVIIGRALPDVRDGLKPVHRRILYAMLREGLTSNRKFSKCAGVVGEVLKRYHPHGDSAVYDALVRMAQPWNMRYPFIEGQGNFGSIDGDPAAAYRYTECRMRALAEDLLSDIDCETVDFTPNFDDSALEPTVLPSRIPALLVNGAEGIAVGMASKIPPHNLREVIAAAIKVIETPDVEVDELMQVLPGPDFPTGGIIYGAAPLAGIYRTGRGLIKIRAKYEIETLNEGRRETEAIIVTEVPYQVNKARLVEKIAELVNEKKITGVSKLRDESDRSGMRIVIELRRDAVTDVVLNQLFKLTPMEKTFGVTMLAIVDGIPRVLSLKQTLERFVDHRRVVVTRRTRFELHKAQARLHLLEGFRIALENIDAVVQLIKS